MLQAWTSTQHKKGVARGHSSSCWCFSRLVPCDLGAIKTDIRRDSRSAPFFARVYLTTTVTLLSTNTCTPPRLVAHPCGISAPAGDAGSRWSRMPPGHRRDYYIVAPVRITPTAACPALLGDKILTHWFRYIWFSVALIVFSTVHGVLMSFLYSVHRLWR